MTATITWSVTRMDCYPQADNETDVVFNVHWTCSGVQDTFTASVYSTCSVPLSAEGPFIPYSELTQETVLGWIWANGVDKDATEAAVQQQIDQQISPSVITPPLPWATQPEPAAA